MQIQVLLFPYRHSISSADIQSELPYVISQSTNDGSGHLFNDTLSVLKEWQKYGFRFTRERVDTSAYGKPGDTLDLDRCYGPDGSYVGDHQFGNALGQQGIIPESAPGGTTSAIGFCESKNKWAGWSHRALVMFGIGDMLFDANHIPNDKTPFVKCGKVKITSLDQARQAAINFADYIS